MVAETNSNVEKCARIAGNRQRYVKRNVLGRTISNARKQFILHTKVSSQYEPRISKEVCSYRQHSDRFIFTVLQNAGTL